MDGETEGTKAAQPEELASDFRHPRLRIDVDEVARRLAPLGQRAWAEPLRNPHHEPPVASAILRDAVPAGVMIPLVTRGGAPRVILTRRPDHISYGGHICFPGGRSDPGDADAVATALRETHEEIGLPPTGVDVLGRLGDYTTQRGVRITPIVARVDASAPLVPEPGEVDEILEVPLDVVLDAAAYRLVRRPDGANREGEPGHRGLYVFEIPGFENRSPRLADLGAGSAFVTGPTVSLMMGFYETLVAARDD